MEGWTEGTAVSDGSVPSLQEPLGVVWSSGRLLSPQKSEVGSLQPGSA